MNVGIIKFTIRMPANQSLKDKRKVVHSLCQKLRNTFGISVAEVESNDNLKIGVIGISFVSNSTQILDQIVAQILSYLREHSGDFVLVDFQQDIIAGF
ncbi:MAG: DUF503 domain-containing protein [Gammaproteobacteria bacterium]|nr:DUF503 domain-containing protein [Gammaproteobacteria bacterium]